MENIKKNKASKSRIRSVPIQFYVTPDEYDFIKLRMKVCHISNISLFMRKIAMREKIDIEDNKPYKNIVKEINAIGRNINQITARINATDNIYKEDVNEIEQRLEKIWQLLQSTR